MDVVVRARAVTGILDVTRLRALLKNALDPATTDEARRSFAMRVCEELFKLGFADDGKVALLVDRATSVVNVPSAASRGKPSAVRAARSPIHRSSPPKVVVTSTGGKKGFREVE